jgi:hypothetical protein
MKSNRAKPISTSMFSVRFWMLNVAFALLLFSSGSAVAEVHYVDLNSTNVRWEICDGNSPRFHDLFDFPCNFSAALEQ